MSTHTIKTILDKIENTIKHLTDQKKHYPLGEWKQLTDKVLGLKKVKTEILKRGAAVQ